eukprot:1421634-Karenia_brevis.AAC.1
MAIVDLGSWQHNPSYATDMKAYIALSRVGAAHDLMLTDMLAPSIFLWWCASAGIRIHEGSLRSVSCTAYLLGACHQR